LTIARACYINCHRLMLSSMCWSTSVSSHLRRATRYAARSNAAARQNPWPFQSASINRGQRLSQLVSARARAFSFRCCGWPSAW
jgi:hypothetical protein